MPRPVACEARRKKTASPVYDLLVGGVKEGEARKIGDVWLVEFGGVADGVAAGDSSFTGAVEKAIGHELDRRLPPLLRLREMFHKNLHELLAMRIGEEGG